MQIHDERIRKDEREKFLIMMLQLDDYILDPRSLEDHTTAWNALKNKIISLRETKVDTND
jgi:hypothetical protein